MTREYSPFTPGVPVPIDFFIGRVDELRFIINRIQKSQDQKSLERIFVIGDRGIGKSSLCKFAHTIAETEYHTLGLHVFLGGVTTLEEMVRRIFERLLKDSIDKAWFGSVKEFLGNNIKKVGLFNITVEFDASNKELERAVSDFVPAIRNLLTKLSEHKKSILLILDDLNGLAGSDRFANWLKSVVDEFATSREPVPLTLVLVGLPERRTQLLDRQPSLDRVFDLRFINLLDKDEVTKFYRTTYSKVNIAVYDDALDVLYYYSDGYPVIMHEIGDAIFNKLEGKRINSSNAILGVFSAVHVIGNKYISPNIVDAIRSEKYKSILNKLINKKISYPYPKSEIREVLSSSELKVFDNFINRMVQLDAMRKKAGGKIGYYEFTRNIYKLYFEMVTPIQDDRMLAAIRRRIKN